MIRDNIVNKDYNPNIITYLWQTKQISKEEYILLKDKYKYNDEY